MHLELQSDSVSCYASLFPPPPFFSNTQSVHITNTGKKKLVKLLQLCNSGLRIGKATTDQIRSPYVKCALKTDKSFCSSATKTGERKKVG